MQTFSELSSWANYRQILSDEFGLHLETDPAEQFLPVRGHYVRLDEWAAAGDCKGTVVLVHGGGGNGRILAPFAEPISQHGWKVIAPDLPGFGLTKPAPDFDWDYAEWPCVVQEIADAQTGPVVLIGASLGGMTAVFAAQQSERVVGVVATTLLDTSIDKNFVQAARWRWLGRLSLLGMAIAPSMLDRVRLPLRLAAPLASMSANKRMQQFFSRDPLIGRSWKPVKFFRTVHGYRLQSPRLACPLLLVHPGSDVWTPTEMSLSALEQIDATKEFFELSNGSHLPLEQPARDELTEQIKLFLNRVAGSVPAKKARHVGQ